MRVWGRVNGMGEMVWFEREPSVGSRANFTKMAIISNVEDAVFPECKHDPRNVEQRWDLATSSNKWTCACGKEVTPIGFYTNEDIK